MGNQITGSPLGFSVSPYRNRVIARGGARAKGTVMAHDLAMSDAGVSDNEVGLETSGLGCVILPGSGVLGHGLFCVLEDAVSDDGKVFATYEGFVDALCKASSGNINPGDPLTVDTSGNLVPNADGTIGHKIVAVYAGNAALSAPTTATLGRVRFSGINPLGVHGG